MKNLLEKHRIREYRDPGIDLQVKWWHWLIPITWLGVIYSVYEYINNQRKFTCKRCHARWEGISSNHWQEGLCTTCWLIVTYHPEMCQERTLKEE